MIDKKLEFAFQFDNAPKEIKDAAAKFRDAYTKYDKAVNQTQLWQDEIRKNESAASKAQAEFNKLLTEWDPLGLKDAKPEEMPAVRVIK